MTRSNHHRLYCGVALTGACLLVMACGDKSDGGDAPAKTESSVESAGGKVRATGAAGSPDGDAAVGGRGGVGAGNLDAAAPEHDGGRVIAADAGSAMPRDGGVSDLDKGAAGAAAGRGAAAGGGGGAAVGGGGEPMAGAGGASAAGSGGPADTVTLTGTVIEVHTDGSFTPYGGAEVCVLDSMPPVCASAASDGKLVIELPANARTGLTMNLPGLFPMLTPITTGSKDINLSGRGEWSNYGAAVVLSEQTRTAATSMLGTMLDPNKGQADMIVFGFGSGTVTLEGAPAELKWFSSGGRFTVTDGPAPFGSTLHGLTNIEPGMRTFRAEMNGKPCMWDPMIWPGDEPGTVTVPIRAGWWTRLMEVRCN